MKDDGGPAVQRGPRRGPAAAAMIGLVRAYRFAISPLFAPSCRYWPSCSEYAIEALQRHGALRGGLAAAARLLRCNPWSAGGVDPVPLALRPFSLRPFSLKRSSSDARWRAYREPSASEPPTTESSSR